MKQKLFIIALLVLSTVAATAQEKKWKFNINGGGIINTGNISNIAVSQGAGADRNDSVLAFSANYKYIYGEQDHVMNNRELSSSLQFDLWQYSTISPFLAATDLINRFKGYENKLSLLVGAKWRIYSVPSICDYSVSAAYVSEFIDYYNDETGLSPNVQRLSLRAKIRQKIGSTTQLKHTTFYMPSFTDFMDDYIITSVTSLENNIYKNVFLGVQFSLEYRNLVPTGKEYLDTRTEITLRVNF